MAKKKTTRKTKPAGQRNQIRSSGGRNTLTLKQQTDAAEGLMRRQPGLGRAAAMRQIKRRQEERQSRIEKKAGRKRR